MRKDFFAHLNTNLTFNVNFVDQNNNPIDISDSSFLFSVAKDYTSETLQTLSLNNGIEIVDSNTATISVNFLPSSNSGFGDFNLNYQLLSTINNQSWVALEGIIYITPSLND